MVERCRAVVVKHLFDPPAPHGLELIVAAVVGEGLEAGQLLSPRAKEGRSLGPLSALPQLLCSLISSQQPPSLVHLLKLSLSGRDALMQGFGPTSLCRLLSHASLARMDGWMSAWLVWDHSLVWNCFATSLMALPRWYLDFLYKLGSSELFVFLSSD